MDPAVEKHKVAPFRRATDEESTKAKAAADGGRPIIEAAANNFAECLQDMVRVVFRCHESGNRASLALPGGQRRGSSRVEPRCFLYSNELAHADTGLDRKNKSSVNLPSYGRKIQATWIGSWILLLDQQKSFDTS